MPLDLKEIDAEIERLQTIRKLAQDPKARATLERLFSANGNGANGASSAASAATIHNAQSEKPRKYGIMKQYALKVLCSTPQTVKQIVEGMIANGWTPTAKYPEASLMDVLANLEKKGLAKRATEKGPYGAFMWTK